jgi:Aspartyl protease
MARNKYIKTGFLIHTLRKQTENHALLNMGATECFIHPQLVNKSGLKEQPLQQPRNVQNVDGTINQAGKTMTGVELTLKLDGKPCDHLFFVMDIGEDDTILGYPFFKSFNPTINWEKG